MTEGKRPGHEHTCIERRGLGFTEYVTLSEWARDVVQDEGFAVEIAEKWLENPDDEHPWNEDQKPGYYEEWLITDAVEFKRALAKLKQELGGSA